MWETMHLSRSIKYKKNIKLTLKGFMLTAGISAALITTNTIAFADTDVSQVLKRWYLEKLEIIEQKLQLSDQSKTTNQKAKLLKRIREQTQKTIIELQEYASKQEELMNQEVEGKMEEASKKFEEKNQVELEEQKKLIDQQV